MDMDDSYELESDGYHTGSKSKGLLGSEEGREFSQPVERGCRVRDGFMQKEALREKPKVGIMQVPSVCVMRLA